MPCRLRCPRVVADIAEQLDGQVELLTVHRVRPVGKIVDQPTEHIDVVVGNGNRQRAVGGGRADVVVGAQVRQVVVVLIGKIAGQCPLGAKHTDPTIAAQEDRSIIQVTAKRVEGGGARHDLDRVDAHLQPEVPIAAQYDTVTGCVGFLVVGLGRLLRVLRGLHLRRHFLGALGLLRQLLGDLSDSSASTSGC